MKPGSDQVKKFSQEEREAAAQHRYAMATKTVGFAESIIVAPGSSPALPGETLLDVHWKMQDGALSVTRFPLEVWPTIREQIDQVYEAMTGPEIHSAEGVDIAAEAKAMESLRGGTPK